MYPGTVPEVCWGCGGMQRQTQACKVRVGAVTDGDWTAFGDECDTETERKTRTDNEPSRPSCGYELDMRTSA